MNQKKLSLWLKAILCGIALCATVVYFVIIPMLGRDIAEQNPEFAFCYLPWLIFLWLTSIPCYLAGGFCWSIACEIGHDRPFTAKNAKSFKKIMIAALADAAGFFLGNFILLFLNMNHPGIVLASMLICFAGAAIAVAAGGLSLLVEKAAAIREDNEAFI